MNSIFEMWSQIIPERAIGCAFNLEYLLAAVMIFANRRSRFICFMSGYQVDGVVEMEKTEVMLQRHVLELA